MYSADPVAGFDDRSVLARTLWAEARSQGVLGMIAVANVIANRAASPYNGTARCKTGDTSRRYVGSVLTNGSGGIINFLQDGLTISLRQFVRALSAGTDTTPTTIALASTVPVTSRHATVRIINTATSGSVRTKTSDDGQTAPSGLVTVGAAADAYVEHPLDASQQMQYWYYDVAPSGGSAYLDVYGYRFSR